MSTAKPHSGAPYAPSAENQKRATRVRKSSFCSNGAAEARYSGRRLSQGLNVKNVHGVRTSESTSGGSMTSSANTAAAIARTASGRARTAAAIPRHTRAMARPGTGSIIWGFLDTTRAACYSGLTL